MRHHRVDRSDGKALAACVVAGTALVLAAQLLLPLAAVVGVWLALAVVGTVVVTLSLHGAERNRHDVRVVTADRRR